jgi:hypothetical protein
MTKQELITHFQEELLFFHHNYNNASDKAKEHVLKNAANGLLDMLMGMDLIKQEDLK